MTFVPALLTAVDEFEAKKIDFPTYKGKLDTVFTQIANQSDADKAKAFDTMFEVIRSGLTEQNRPYDSGDGVQMYSDSDQTHYDWEAAMKAIFGEDFFDFYNRAYASD